MARIDALPDVLARRARHVVSQNQRVLSAAEALSAGDVERLAPRFAESHASMRDDFEILTREIDAVVDICKRDDDVLGARLTGGGFGGALVMMARAGTARTAARRIKEEYIARTGRPGVLLIP
jgi:galactokinase